MRNLGGNGRFWTFIWLILILLPWTLASQELSRFPGGAEAANARAIRPYGRLRALLVGVNDYRCTDLARLTLAEKDALSMAERLKTNYGFQVDVLLGPDATKRGILEKFEEIQTQLGPDDVMVFFFAGHGYTLREGDARRGLLIPAGVCPGAETGWVRQALDLRDELPALVNRIRARHVLFLLDACFSGFVGKRSGSEPLNHGLVQILNSPSRLVMTAGTENESAYEDPQRFANGFFTHSLLEVLQSDKPLPTREIHTLVRRWVAEISNGRMTPQLREISVENGELVFIPVQAVKGDASPSRQISQMQVGGQRLLAQAGSTYGYSDFLGVMNTMSYRFATNMADQERVWRRRLEQMRDHAAAGNPWAMAALSYAYDRGLGAEPNAKLASFWAAEAFDTGHPVGAFALARCVKNGCNGSPNPILARELIRRSDSGGFAPATAWLAEENLFQQPAGDSGSASATLPKLAAAAEGIHWAEFAVARAYADPPSKSITKDLRKAAQIFERLANQGYPQAQNQMFRLRYMGVDGVARRDPDSARRWLESAAALGDRESQYWLAAAYYQEPGFLAVKLGMPKNFALALQWAELAAKQKEPGGLMLLANAHQYGRGVPVDFAKARQFCESAIELNDSDALVVMAGWLLEGEVVARNDQQAVQLLTRAVAQQNPNAMFLLGTCYEQARGLDLQGQSPREMRPHLYHHALHHYIQAAQRDHPDATAKVESFLKQVRRHEPEVGSFEDLVQGGDWPAKDFLQPLRRAYPESYLWIESRLQGKR